MQLKQPWNTLESLGRMETSISKGNQLMEALSPLLADTLNSLLAAQPVGLQTKR